ncbi:MAG: ATP--guanido phosphotransferase [Treponema sp.]
MNTGNNAWYTASGNDTDIIVSSRVRIARNIKGFQFPPVMNAADSAAVYETVLDAFKHIPNPELFHPIHLESLDPIAKKIFEERSVIPLDTGSPCTKGFVIREDGVLSSTINMQDHIRSAAFYTGFDLLHCFHAVDKVTDELAKQLDFSAVQDYGYLSSDIYAIGSGMKASVLCTFPAFSLTGNIQKKIQKIADAGFEVHAYYTQSTKMLLGYLYLISSKYAAGGTDIEQLIRMADMIQKLIDEERVMREVLMRDKLWYVQDVIIKAFSLAKNALLLDLKETIDLIFQIKLGINLGFITGITHEACTTLLYQTQTAHIAFLLLNGNIEFEEDFPSDELRIERIRALLLQDALKTTEIRVRKTLK